VYGIPYIPGTALKGITRDIAIAELCDEIDEKLDVMDTLLSMPDISEVTDEEEKPKLIEEAGKVKRQDGQSKLPKPETIKKIRTGWDRFKTVQNVFGSQHEVGKIIFLDAFPETTPKLQADIMNPHYPKYYSEQQAPSDWQNPVPIPFLTLEQAIFIFSLAVKKSEFGDDQFLHTTAKWLKHALQEHGLDAKTAVGYGYFQV
jgi:CRISPR-associated protein Cmr6